MRFTVALLFVWFTIMGVLGSEKASAAAPSAGAICKAAAAASLVSKVHCRVVRKCSYFGCSYQQVCA